ncbi:MAG: Mu-like protein prophage protein gp29-like protein [Limisphaerales bacterium]|nr:MAG: Mu-like protein prophage protein gp29-like protein [Limisphaerales bacterium]KAG0508101.1 MAG: Mu-like protein prophage protein gp29-like protein [Limisphaerales bacterium]TXT53046.1 MAG: Mu-like protein prophage protein gp29-like protein [Limisphaerales bacterium]
MNADDSIIDAAKIEQAIQQRYSPFPSMTMELLNSQLNAFRVGELRPVARTWEIMLERDGDLSSPAQQRFADAARLPWLIEKEDDSKEAQDHHDALLFFYTHLTATSVLEQNEAGGASLLFRQMMTAKAFKYSVHEMLLRISSAGRREVTAELRHCPVWFFECRRGRLGFIKEDYAAYGIPCERGEWVAAVERFPAMPACSVAYITKWRPLADWLLFCFRFGVPGIHGETTAVKGSAEWDAFVAALRAFANDWVTATSGAPGSNKINLIEAAKGGTGTLPFQELVERADRLYARQFRGGDLGTQSREGGDVSGASLQGNEGAIKLADDAQWLTDNCNANIDEPVIAYLFKAQPKAWLRVQVPKKIETDREVKAMEFLRNSGGRISIKSAHERLQVPLADADEAELLTAPAQPAVGGLPVPPDLGLGNTGGLRTLLAEDLQHAIRMVREQHAEISGITDATLRKAKLDQLFARVQRDIGIAPAIAQALLNQKEVRP